MGTAIKVTHGAGARIPGGNMRDALGTAPGPVGAWPAVTILSSPGSLSFRGP